jgi:peptide/nickel transport system permease protein
MLTQVTHRLLAFIPTLFIASVILFLAINVVPGSAAKAALGIDATAQAIARFEHQHGLDRPLHLQYLEWLGHALRGDFGASFQNHVPVGPEILKRLPLTLELAGIAFLIAVVISVPCGALAAYNHQRRLDKAITLVATEDPLANLRLMIMPALSLGIVSSALLIRIMRTAMLEILNSNFIVTAKAKGADGRTIIQRHALRNALIPFLTVGAVEFGFLVGSVVIIEDIFLIPGIGSLVLVGIINRDYPVLLASALVITVIVLSANMVVDLIATLLDPRQVHTKS